MNSNIINTRYHRILSYNTIIYIYVSIYISFIWQSPNFNQHVEICGRLRNWALTTNQDSFAPFTIQRISVQHLRINTCDSDIAS